MLDERLSYRAVLLFFLTLTISVLAACGSEEKPEVLSFDLSIADGKLDIEDDTIKVKQGDDVTFRIDADAAGGFHLHGYDIVKDVGPGSTTEMRFTADATGRFSILLHLFGEEHSDSTEHEEEEVEIQLATLEVLPR